MIIGISGSQGQGKTTLADGLVRNDSSFEIIGTNLARSTMYHMDLTLDDINTNHYIKRNFQNKLLNRMKLLYTDEHIMSEKKYILDRTYLDLFVYTLIGLGYYNEHNNFVDDYYNKCIEYHKDIAMTYILSGRELKVENDGIRGYNQHYSVMVSDLMEKFSAKMIKNFYCILRLENKEDKISAILTYLKVLNEQTTE